jgi:hypothetical protein
MKPSRVLGVLALSALALASGGCLKRTIAVTTEPPGALVWLNDVEIGRTPVETDFTYYGVYDVRVRREGYEPIATKMKANTPIYEQPGLDLVAEALPTRTHTVIRWHFDLAPVAEAGDRAGAEKALIERAAELRGQATPPPAPEPTPER